VVGFAVVLDRQLPVGFKGEIQSGIRPAVNKWRVFELRPAFQKIGVGFLKRRCIA